MYFYDVKHDTFQRFRCEIPGNEDLIIVSGDYDPYIVTTNHTYLDPLYLHTNKSNIKITKPFNLFYYTSSTRKPFKIFLKSIREAALQ